MDKVMRLASEKGVVIFTKSSCCLCYAVNILFKEIGVVPSVYEIDKDPEGREMEKAITRDVGDIEEKRILMERLINKQPSRWWIESHSLTKRSPWLQATLDELNEKTNTMLKLIEEDADSFAKRAEMYYKKRPELVSMVEDFYRSHRSLAERYDQVRPDTWFHPLPKNNAASPTHASHKKWLSFGDHVYDSYSDEKSMDSEVDNPDKDENEIEEEEKERYTNSTKEKDVGFVNVKANNDEVMKARKDIESHNEENKAHEDEIKQKDTSYDELMMLREEVERLRKDNRAQKERLQQKDEEKIQVIRQMSVAIDMLKQENVRIRSYIETHLLKLEVELEQMQMVEKQIQIQHY
ncbi:unnamed protein product [Lupinus luteus]|uniref:NAB domain-containing protein n=1 Tax=Lupinus luteus TaxID=3873 RepID=A0AAV1XGB9_LUPLU